MLVFEKFLIIAQLVLIVLQIIFTFLQIKKIEKSNYRARNAVVTVVKV